MHVFEGSRPPRNLPLAACVEIMENLRRTPKASLSNLLGSIEPRLRTTALVNGQDQNLLNLVNWAKFSE